MMLKAMRGRGSAAGRPRAEGANPANPANPIDVHVGARVRLRRALLGLSQEQLGEAVGLSFQQIQKCERGANRIGASRLHELSLILDVPVSFFFDDLAEADRVAMTPREGLTGAGEGVADAEDDPQAKREALALVRAYYRIAEPDLRKRLFELVKAVAGADRAVEKSG